MNDILEIMGKAMARESGSLSSVGLECGDAPVYEELAQAALTALSAAGYAVVPEHYGTALKMIGALCESPHWTSERRWKIAQIVQDALATAALPPQAGGL